MSSFSDENPRRFGLIQRDRDFLHYQDLELVYHRRPSYWVEPVGDWGKGRVELVEIPTDEEINDNIVAYLGSGACGTDREGLDFSYRLRSVLDSPERPPLGRVVSTKIGSSKVPGRSDMPREGRHFVLDFEGGDIVSSGPSSRWRLCHHQFRRVAPAHRAEEYRDRRLAGLLRPAAREQACRPALRSTHARPDFD